MVKLVNPSVEIITEIDSKKILQNIEKAARTCYKTESSMTEDGESAKRMINKLIDKCQPFIICKCFNVHSVFFFSYSFFVYCFYCHVIVLQFCIVLNYFKIE